MREIEIRRAVRECLKCAKCYASEVEAACPMNEEFGIQPFSPPGIFYLADGILDGYVKKSKETSIVPFSCTMCGACAKRCFTIPLHCTYEYPTKLIEDIRGMFGEVGEVPEKTAEALRNLVTFKNAWRLPKSERVKWEKKCEVSIPDYTKGRNEFLLFIGDASLIPETQHIPSVLAKLLQKGGGWILGR